MATEKMATTSASGTDTPPSIDAHDALGQRRMGKPWMYKKMFGFLPAYASPEFQIVFVAFVCFLCPGMFNAVNGLGAGGVAKPYDINRANIGVYATFSIVGFFGGSVANTIGLRPTLAFGGIGYFIYVIALLVYKHTENAGFLIFSGCLLGLCAGLLWTAQGAIMMAYPLERQKGRFVAVFWFIFNLGAVIGALVPLGQNIHSKAAGAVNDGTYIAFIILMFIGFIITFVLCNPHFVERKDGSRVILMKNPTWKSEFLGLLETLKTDWYIVFLFPFFIASNWFYTYHFQDVNLPMFNVRTRSLNNVLYWMMQMVGALVFGYALDYDKISRSMRAKLCLGTLLAITLAIWGGGYSFQSGYTRESTDLELNPDFEPLDWTDSGYIGPMFLYMFYGFYDAAYQTCAYWYVSSSIPFSRSSITNSYHRIMGSLTNNGRKLANFAGFYKGIQSAGSAITPAIDNAKVPYMTEFASTWGLLAASIVFAAPVVWLKVTDSTAVEEDLKFTDETMADVAAVPDAQRAGSFSEKH